MAQAPLQLKRHLHPHFECSVHLHGREASWLLNTTTKRGQRSRDRQRRRIFRGAAFRAAGSSALEPQTGWHRVCAHCGAHLRAGSERGQVDCVNQVRRAGNLERRRCVSRRWQEDETVREPLAGFERRTLVAALTRDLPRWSSR